jgi:uncharacterized protein YbjT (DUF2867 family)
MILITGAAGKTGQALVGALAARNRAVRAFVRRSEQISSLQYRGATEVMVGDLRNIDDLRRACQTVDAIYHICPNMQPDEVAIAQQLIAAAQTAGVDRFVYHSVLHPQTVAMPHHWQKLRVEELLFTTALDYTILQPAAYMQNVLANWSMIKTQGVYRIPYATSTVLGMVDLHDVAEAAAQVLTAPGHRGATYELASDEWLTQEAVAAMLSEGLGRPVRAVEQARAQWQAQVRKAGLSDYAVDTLLKMFDYYERFGFGGNGNVLTWLLGRRPTSFADWLCRHIAEETADDDYSP